MSHTDRREPNRRSGTDRRGNQRRRGTDRRAGALLDNESPTEHVRNAMQLLVNALESDDLTPADLTGLAESALARLSLAVNAMEKPR